MSISDQLKNINVSQLKINGKSVEQVLKEEAKRLKNCIDNQIKNYYDSYTPSVYDRTNRFQNSFTVDDVVTINATGNEFQITIHTNDMAWHDSWNGEGAYVPLLINNGWEWKNNPHIEHLSEYDGYHFIEKGIADFNRSNSLGIKIRLQETWQGTTIFDDYI